MAYFEGIAPAGGVIDSDYRGNIGFYFFFSSLIIDKVIILGVILFNHSNESYNVRWGEKIAQIVRNIFMLGVLFASMAQTSSQITSLFILMQFQLLVIVIVIVIFFRFLFQFQHPK